MSVSRWQLWSVWSGRRLFAPLCLLAASASAGPVDPRPDPDACQLLTNLDLEPLLFGGEGGTLDNWSNHPAAGMSTCRWEARPKGRPASAPPRVATLAFFHLADRERARSQLAAQPHGADTTRGSLAMDGRGDDELVRSAPAVIVARHGADVAVLDARGAEVDDPERIETRYLLDALALKAAGATVKHAPWANPGQTAGWAPLSAPDSAASGDAGWTPPANAGAITSSLLAWPLRVLLFVTRHGFLMLFVGLFGPVAIGAALTRRPSPARSITGSSSRPIRYVLAPLVIVGVIANLVFGSAMADKLLYRFGVAAAATVTGRYATSTQYNNHDVMGYHVLLRPPTGGTVATRFEDDDFNVYPPHNATSYPGQGDVFTVRYLSRFPGEFTIVSNDGSPWATGMRCASLRDALSQAERRANFSHAAPDRQSASQASVKMAAAHCAPDK